MGFDAVYLASDSQLQDELGIKELGVRLSLKAYCEKHIKNEQNIKSSNERDERKRRLLEEIINPKKSKATSSKKVSGRKPIKRSVNRIVLISWIHCDKDKKPKQVGLEKGGGICTLTATTDTTYEDLSKSGKECFFPKGKCQFGSEKEMILGLADFQRKTLGKKHDGVTFTVGNYAEKNGLKSRIRVYLTSQPAEIILSDCSNEDEDDDFLLQTSIQTESWLQQPTIVMKMSLMK